MDLRLCYITAGSREEAKKIGRALVEERLAACANVIDGMESVYWWQGKLTEDREAVLIVKTRAELVAAVTARVKALHSYTTPAIMVLPVESVDAEYYRWILEEAKAAP